MPIPRSSPPLAFAAALLLAACSSTTKIAEWRDTAYTGGAVGTVLVIGVFRDETTRRLFEQGLVERIRAGGGTATAGFEILPAREKVSRESVRSAIEGRGIDAVLVAHLLGIEKRRQYVPPTYAPIPARHYSGYYGYYSHTFDTVYQPGYYQNFEVATVESSLYDVETEKPVWTMQTESVDPGLGAGEIDDAVEVIFGALRDQGLL